jgi:hypothetical protein
MDGPLRAADEHGTMHTWQPIAMQFSSVSIRNSSEASAEIRVDGVDGAMLRAFYGLRADDLRKVVNATMRRYIVPTHVDQPADNPIHMRVAGVTITMTVVTLSLLGGSLPNRRAGRFYTFDRFVSLRPF